MAGESRYQVKPEERINVRAFSSLLSDTPASHMLGDPITFARMTEHQCSVWRLRLLAMGPRCPVVIGIPICLRVVLTHGMAGDCSLRPPHSRRWCGSARRVSWAMASRRSSARQRRWSCMSSRPAPSAARRVLGPAGIDQLSPPAPAGMILLCVAGIAHPLQAPARSLSSLVVSAHDIAAEGHAVVRRTAPSATLCRGTSACRQSCLSERTLIV